MVKAKVIKRSALKNFIKNTFFLIEVMTGLKTKTPQVFLQVIVVEQFYIKLNADSLLVCIKVQCIFMSYIQSNPVITTSVYVTNRL